MSTRYRATALSFVAFVALVALAVLAVSSGDKPYRLVLQLDNANGLRQGGDVRVAGVKAGAIGAVELTKDDHVRVELDLDRNEAPVGRDATVAIEALNLLGQKRVELTKGDISSPAPDGYVIPSAHVATSTDLDQVLSVLDNNTRTRLAVLINEAGRGVLGRKGDISTVLDQMPGAVNAAQDLLRRVHDDDRALGELVDSSSSLVARVSREHRVLTGALESLKGTATTFAERRVALRATLEQTPETLRSLTRMLARLRETTVPLGPAARKVADVAPELRDTLSAVGGFTEAAKPTFAQAVRASPGLTRLARTATPVLVKATKTAAALNRLAADNEPLAGTLMKSADNIIAIVDNWSHAIQFRDGLSHVFRGSVSLDPAAVAFLLRKWGRPASSTTGSKRRPTKTTPTTRPLAVPKPADTPKLPAPPVTPPTVQDSVGALMDLIGAVTRRPEHGAPSGASNDHSLLDFLLAP